MISCIIPVTRYDINHLLRLLLNLIVCASYCKEEEVEVLIIENGEKGEIERLVESFDLPMFKYVHLATRGRVAAKNFGAELAKGDTLVFIDADSVCSYNLFQEVYAKSRNGEFFGGGCNNFTLSRGTPGVLAFLLFVLFVLIIKGIWNPFNPFSLGIFWIRKSVFKELGGWRHVTLKDLSSLFSFIPPAYQMADDIDFAWRMKQFEPKSGSRFASLENVTHIWSTRKFDDFGSWSWLFGVKKDEKRVALLLGSYGG